MSLPPSQRPLSWASRIAFDAWAKVRGRPLMILTFHRVVPEPDPMLPGEIDAARFDGLVRFLAGTFRVLPLGRAAQQLAAGTLPSRALVLTFDDGYADNADVALPVLRRHDLPATFFVSSGFLDGGLMWNDVVIEALRATRREAVDLAAFGLGRVDLGDLPARRAAMDRLLPVVKYLGPADRRRALDTLLGLLGHPALPQRKMMRPEQVRALHAAGMEIGAHTVHHPILQNLDADAAWAEITGGRDALAALVDAPVEVMAYPNGRPGKDYGSEHVEMLRRAGFRAAVSTAPGVARAGADLLQLPRLTPWGRTLGRWSARLFRQQMAATYAVAASSTRTH